MIAIDIRKDWKCLVCGITNVYHDKWCIRFCFTPEGTTSRNPKM